MKFDEEVSMHQILRVFTKRWRYLIILALVFSLGALIKHKYFPIYPAFGKLLIQDVKNSQLQSIVLQASGTNFDSLASETKDENSVTRSISLLDTKQFYVNLAERLSEINSTIENNSLKALIGKYKVKFGEEFYLSRLALYLEEAISFTPMKDGRLQIKAIADRKEISVLILNETLVLARDHLINRDLRELTMAEKYFQSEIEIVKSRLDGIESKTINKMQKSQIISVDMEKGETSKYQGQLKKNVHDLQIQIEENNKRIVILNSNKVELKNDITIGKYSETSLVKRLEEENSELSISLQTYQSYLKDLERQNKGLVPFQYDIEKMKSSYSLENKIYENLRESLAKIGLQKIYVKNKVEILELENGLHVRSTPGLSIMILIAIMISQILGIVLIYLYELLKP